MTSSINSVNTKELISVVMFSTGSRESTLTNLKQLFSLKPENWQLDVQLVLESANDATLKLINSLGLAVSIVEAKGKTTDRRVMTKVMRNLGQGSDAVLWLGANTALKSDAYIQVNNFRKQYPSAVLIGQFQDDATSQISAGGYSGKSIFGHRTRIQAQTLPIDVSAFDASLVLVPASASELIGQPTTGFKRFSHFGLFVRAAKRKRIRCLALPGFLGSFNG